MKKFGKHRLYRGDCLKIMPKLEEHSIDLVLCDLPYGTTACKWDTIIDFSELWAAYARCCTHNCVFVLFGTQPFTSALISSNVKGYKHSWVWNKKLSANGPLARFQPLKIHEDIVVFCNGKGAVYNPQGTLPCSKTNYRSNTQIGSSGKHTYTQTITNFPKSIIEFSSASRKEKVHPTQKPVSLLEYLILTYSNKGMTVLDNTMGSGSTGVACVNTGRKFIGIEKEPEYFKISVARIREARKQLKHNVNS